MDLAQRFHDEQVNVSLIVVGMSSNAIGPTHFSLFTPRFLQLEVSGRLVGRRRQRLAHADLKLSGLLTLNTGPTPP